jgi:DNA processing protein
MDNKDILIWLNNIKGLGNKTIDKLIDYFGDLQSIWNASCSKIEGIENISRPVKNEILNTRNSNHINNLRSRLEDLGVDVITIYDENYPKLLKETFDPPKILYIKGNIKKEDNISIAIVGARKATPYGKWAAEKFTYELSNLGLTIVSGMARGIDTVVHRTSLKANARTIAVLGNGINVIYPKVNRDLFTQVSSSGAIITEFPLDMQPFSRNFPQRNRIISGISLGVIVIEAKEKSGSLITASHALEQGREVFAVPGNINSVYSTGTNKLIRDGAKIIMDVDDILEEISELASLIKFSNKEKIKNYNLNAEEKRIIECIRDYPVPFDIIVSKTCLEVSKVSSILSVLEMEGLIKRLPGNLFTTK